MVPPHEKNGWIAKGGTTEHAAECRETELNLFEAVCPGSPESMPMPAGRVDFRLKIDTDCMNHRT